jgi:Zn-dependent M28 family amino/carboxypeptidase
MRKIARVTIPLFITLIAITTRAEEIRYSPLSMEEVEARLKQFAGKDSQREETLKRLFQEAGCNENLTEQSVKGSKLPNVICTLPGSSDRTIIVGAHFDHDSSGDGVVDNWSGASLLPSLYEAIKNEPRRHSFVFIGFAGEEEGQVGSRYYAKRMTKEEIARTDAMVNMDTLGLASTEVETGHSDKKLASALVYTAQKVNLPLTGVGIGSIGISDSWSFADRRIPSITIHSLTQEAVNARILHSSSDKFSAIRMNDYYQTYCLMSAYLSLLDLVPQATTDAGSR